MKVNVEELIKKRLKCKWFVCEKTIFDEMINDAIAKDESEFEVILSPKVIKEYNFRCAYPCLKKFFVTGIFELGKIVPYSGGMYYEEFLEYSLVTFSKKKTKLIKICGIRLQNLLHGFGKIYQFVRSF